jgi:hypothetical protein
MPRYYFNANGPVRTIEDAAGKRLRDLEAARQIALEAARDLIRDAHWEGWSFHITDETGYTLLVVPFTDAVVKH